MIDINKKDDEARIIDSFVLPTPVGPVMTITLCIIILLYIIIHNKTLHFKSSSTPGIFTNHQEILMEVDKEWA